MTDAEWVARETDEAHFSWGGHESEDMATDNQLDGRSEFG